MTGFLERLRGAVPEALLPGLRLRARACRLSHGRPRRRQVSGRIPVPGGAGRAPARRARGSCSRPPDSLDAALEPSTAGRPRDADTIDRGRRARDPRLARPPDRRGRSRARATAASRARACRPAPRPAATRRRELRDGDADRFGGRGRPRRGAERPRDDRAGASSVETRSTRRSWTPSSIALDGTADKSAAGRERGAGGLDRAARAPPRRRRGSRSGGISAAGSVLPLPMVNIISGGLHADTRLAFQDFLVVPVGAETFREALECASAVRTATGAMLRERGLSTLKAAEGGFAPPLRSPEAALDLLVEAVARSGRSLGDEVAFAVDVAATHFFDGTVYRLEDTPDGIDADGLDRAARAMTVDLSDRLDRGRAGRGRLGGVGTADRAPRRPRPDPRRRSLRDEPRAVSDAASTRASRTPSS